MTLYASSRLFVPLGIEEGAALAWRCGYDGVELWYEQLGDRRASELRRAFPQELVVSIHAASWDVNLTSTNPRIAAVAVDEVERSIEWGTALGASCVVVHPGRASSTKESAAACSVRQRETFERLLARAQRCGVRLAVENMERRSKELVVSPGEVGALIEAVGDPGLFVCLDTAHAFTAGGVDSFLASDWADRIAHCHVSHTTGRETHAPLDRGTSTMTPRLREFLIGFRGAVVIEGAEREPKDVQALLICNREAFTRFLNGRAIDDVR